jgi:hypothetical protein
MTWWVLEQRDIYSRQGENACYAEPLEPINLEPSSTECPDCGSALEPGFWAPPRTARLSGSPCGDLIQSPAFELLISTRARDVFEREAIVGFARFDSISLNGQTSYIAARPRVTITRLDEARSGVTWRRAPTCSRCRLGVRESIERVVIDEATWDGSDIFMASGFYGVLLVTSKFVDSVARNRLSNFEFVRAGEYRGRPGDKP